MKQEVECHFRSRVPVVFPRMENLKPGNLSINKAYIMKLAECLSHCRLLLRLIRTQL